MSQSKFDLIMFPPLAFTINWDKLQYVFDLNQLELIKELLTFLN